MQLEDLKGLGKVRIETLRAAGIISLRDLLYYMPKGYKDTVHPVPLKDVQPYEPAAVQGAFKSRPRLNRFKGMSSVTGLFCDASGSLTCVWYNQPWMAGQLNPEGEYILYGRVEVKNGKRQMLNPSIEKERAILPVYRPLPSLPSKTLAGLMRQALDAGGDCIKETLPEGLRSRHGLMGALDAVRETHFPTSRESLLAARRRMAFEKALFFQAGMSLFRLKNDTGVIIPLLADFEKLFWQSLAFEPTDAQKRVLHEILRDMADIAPMSRLVQGDVGCGKTAVAMGAILCCVKAGFQGAMMAPTEILAGQHYEGFKKYFENQGIGVGYLHGGLRTAQRRAMLQKIASGEVRVVVGTHALISKDVQYQNLGLVVTDEQHRFGVSQRTALIKKSSAAAPNVLVMSATPIPRTLALILYGDLDISVIDEMPKGRTPVATRIVPEEKREGMYAFIRQEVQKGRQAYVVCPLVEDSEELEEVKAAQSHYRELKSGPLKSLRVGLTYGGQPQQEKSDVIDAFQKAQIDVLVSTTVIEVGVNVPNATVMVIEDAYRFGLSQLHQLRGRVGRGGGESWCFLLSEPNERLKTLASTNDGFVIAQKDLELRGPGELIGTRQHGHAVGPEMDLQGDVKLLEEVSDCLRQLRQDPHLKAEKAIVEAHARQYVRGKLEHISFN